MSNIGSYENRLKGFEWSLSEKELGYKAGDIINIGWYCSDRICKLSMGDKPALLWEDNAGNEKGCTSLQRPLPGQKREDYARHRG